MTFEVSNARICTIKSNKLRYLHSIRGTPRDIAVKRESLQIRTLSLVYLSADSLFDNASMHRTDHECNMSQKNQV